MGQQSCGPSETSFLGARTRIVQSSERKLLSWARKVEASQMRETPEAGQVVGGKYRLLRGLGEGGMGAVYEAENIGSGKRVAIKRLHPHLLADPSSVERFVREARVASRVRHPNVVDLYDVDRDAHGPFLVMEMLEGEPLSTYLQRGQFGVGEMLALISGAMRGAAAAHRKGIVHRDIKPENIFLAREAEEGPVTPKVLDFGISKLLVPDAGEVKLTKTGALFGTPMYMCYEQLAGATDLDARADVYSFGVILYEALTGHHPYDAYSFPQLIARFATSEPVPARRHRPDLPEALERVVMSALYKDRTLRTSSLDALIAAVRPFLHEREQRSTRPGPARPTGPSIEEVATHAPHERQPPNFAVNVDLAAARGRAPASILRSRAGGRASTLRSRAGGRASTSSHSREAKPIARRWPLALAALSLLAAVSVLTWSLVSEPGTSEADMPARTGTPPRGAASLATPLPATVVATMPGASSPSLQADAGRAEPRASTPPAPSPSRAVMSNPSRASTPLVVRAKSAAASPPTASDPGSAPRARRRVPQPQIDQF
jgi:serine/threonine-protein kinase